MSNTVTQAFVQQWDTAIRAAAQQTDSRFMPFVTDRGQVTGEAFTINNLSAITLDPNVVRHGDTEWKDITHSTRLAYMSDFYSALPLDRNDIPKMLVNPVTGGDYMKQLMNAKNRAIDATIFNAAMGNATLKGGSTVTLPAGQKILPGGTGFTKAKAITIAKIFRGNEADQLAGEDIVLAYNSRMLSDILSDTTLTSSDFISTQMLQEGKVSTKWLGLTWVPYEAIGFDGTTYTTVAWAKSGVHFGKGYEEGNVTRRGDKKDLWQVSFGASYGAGRQDEAKVVTIQFV